MATASTMDAANSGISRTVGDWSEQERAQFEKAVVIHGWGNWIQAERLIPSRTNAQIKSHAQKFRKHHLGEYERLKLEHERKVLAGAKVRNKTKANASAPSKVTPKAATTRGVARRGNPTKAKKHQAKVTPPSIKRSLRPRRRCSAPDRFQMDLPVKKATSPRVERRSNYAYAEKKSRGKTLAKFMSAKSNSPSLPPGPLDDALMEVTSAVGRVTLASAAPPITPVLSSLSMISSEKLAGPLDVDDLMSPLPKRRSNMPAMASTSGPHDELAALAAVVTPTFPCDRRSVLDDVKHTAFMEEDLISDEFDHMILPFMNKHLAKVNEEEVTDDPMLLLPLEEDNLDMFADFFEPNDFFTPTVPNATSNETPDPLAAAEAAVENALKDMNNEDLKDVSKNEEFQIPANVRPDLKLFLNIKSHLNDPKEYVMGPGGLSRMSVEKGALCRIRIKDLLDQHLKLGWWKDETFDSNATGGSVIESTLSTLRQGVQGNRGMGNYFKKLELESFIALTTVMHDVDHWHMPRKAQHTAAGTTEDHRFNDEDDIRHIGQLLSGLWERVSRSLCRDAFFLLGESVSERLERSIAVNTMVTSLDLISRMDYVEEQDIKPPCVRMFEQV